MPESRDRDDVRLKARDDRLNDDLDTLHSIFRFVLIDGRSLIGKTDLFFDSSGDRATEQAQEKTIESIADRFVDFYKFWIRQEKTVSDRERSIRSVGNCPFFKVPPCHSRKYPVSRYWLNPIRIDYELNGPLDPGGSSKRRIFKPNQVRLHEFLSDHRENRT